MNSEQLRRLEVMGVDNWSGHEMAIWNHYGDFDNSIEDWEEEDLPDLLAEFPDYVPKEFDNYNY